MTKALALWISEKDDISHINSSNLEAQNIAPLSKIFTFQKRQLKISIVHWYWLREPKMEINFLSSILKKCM